MIVGERSWGFEDDTVLKNEPSGFMGTHGGSGPAVAHRPWGLIEGLVNSPSFSIQKMKP